MNCHSLFQSDLDGVHKVRVAFGNGLRIDIWEEFKNRFKIPNIVEFFGATEGTGIFLNVTGKVGAIGRMSPLMVSRQAVSTILKICIVCHIHKIKPLQYSVFSMCIFCHSHMSKIMPLCLSLNNDTQLFSKTYKFTVVYSGHACCAQEILYLMHDIIFPKKKIRVLNIPSYKLQSVSFKICTFFVFNRMFAY